MKPRCEAVYTFQRPTPTQESYARRMREAVDRSIELGNSTSAYVYARMAARFAQDWLLVCVCESCMVRRAS